MQEHGAFLMPFLRCVMINVTIEHGKITASGHAGYAPKGYDIVCAAFSMLSLTLDTAVKKFTNDNIQINLKSGSMIVRWQQVSPNGQLLINAYIEGVKALAENYPEYIKVQARNTLKAEEKSRRGTH